jgi:hypothetical protein
MFSPSRYRSIHYSKFKAAARLLTRPIPAMFRDNYMGPFLPNHTLAEPEIFRTHTTLRQGKNVASEGGGLIGLCFRGTMSQSSNTKHLNLGKTMTIIPMIPVGPVTTLNRSILLTERRMSGTGGDDFICGHCGHVMLEDFDPSTVRGNPVYQCGVCENNNDLPFAATDARHWPSR